MFFTRSNHTSNRPLNRKEQLQKDISYLKDLKARTKCYNCGKYNYNVKPEKQRSQLPRDFIHRDLSNKIQPPSLYGSLYYVLYKDDATGFHFNHFIKHKNGAFPFFKKSGEIDKTCY